MIPSGAYSLETTLADSELTAASSIIVVPRDAGTTSWSHDPSANGPITRQVLQIAPVSAPTRLAVVIDSSASMAASAQSIAEAVSHLPPRLELYVIFADDLADPDVIISPTTPLDAAASIRSREFIGGQDNTAALAQALNKVLSSQASALVWIHGPQPVILQSSMAIEQKLDRRGQVRWYDVQVTPGSNLIAERLDELANIQTLSLSRLQALFARWRSGGDEIIVRRQHVPGAGPPAEQTSDHLARLRTYDEVRHLLYVERAPRQSIIELAHRYRLVTPVTGAAVLETQQQYHAAGLTPVPEGTVPSIPEPEEWALMIIAAIVLLSAWRRQRYATA